MPDTPQAGGNPPPDRPHVPPQQQGTPRHREPGPRQGGPPADNGAQARQSKQSNAASPKPGRSFNDRRPAPPPIPDITPAVGQPVEVYTDHSGRDPRRPDGNPPLAEPSMPATRPPTLSAFTDFHERRASATNSVDDEIRLLREHERFYLVLLLPWLLPAYSLLVLLVIVTVVAMASGLGFGLVPAAATLGAGTIISVIAHLLRAAISSHPSTRQKRRPDRPRRR